MIRLIVRCTRNKDHAKVLKLREGTSVEVARHLAKLLDGSSELFIYPPGEGSPIGRCAQCGATLTCEVQEVAK